MMINFETINAPLNPATAPYELKVVTGMQGDVNGDGRVNIFDLLELLKVLSGKVEESTVSDIDQKGKTNIFDLLELLKILSSN